MDKNIFFMAICLLCIMIGGVSCDNKAKYNPIEMIGGSKIEKRIEDLVDCNPNSFNNTITKRQFVEKLNGNIRSFVTDESCLSDFKLKCAGIREPNGYVLTFFEGEIYDRNYTIYLFVDVKTPNQYVSQLIQNNYYNIQFRATDVSVDEIQGENPTFRIYIDGELKSIIN